MHTAHFDRYRVRPAQDFGRDEGRRRRAHRDVWASEAARGEAGRSASERPREKVAHLQVISSGPGWTRTSDLPIMGTRPSRIVRMGKLVFAGCLTVGARADQARSGSIPANKGTRSGLVPFPDAGLVPSDEAEVRAVPRSFAANARNDPRTMSTTPAMRRNLRPESRLPSKRRRACVE
jgi:hypothetical protein